MNHGVCSVSIKRNLRVAIQGRPSRGVGMEEIMFESLDQNGIALNMAEVAILPEEVPLFTKSLSIRASLSVLSTIIGFYRTEYFIYSFSICRTAVNIREKTAAALSVLR